MLEIVDLHKTYLQGKIPVNAVDGVSFRVEAGEFLAITGPSGSGKSTLLNLISGLDDPSSGDVLLQNESLIRLSDAERTRMRRSRIGFIFQFFNLLPTMSAADNVALPLLLAGQKRRAAYARAEAILEQVGMGHRVKHRPDELSGGEQQRVAIARALVFDPVLILADEPTGNLDSKSGTQVMEMITSLSKKFGKAVVLVTHDPRCWQYCDRIVHLVDGRIQKIEDRRTADAGVVPTS